MITENELRIANESYTHKDFYQIYPEILEIAKKLSIIWNPANSNESDPGVVLLKLLAFIADKINYNIDKQTLENFPLSATQESSMRKICEMMGYNMKYYQSATTDVSFMWTGEGLETTPIEGRYIVIPQWTELTDDSGEILYTLTQEIDLKYKGQIETKQAIEGKCCDVLINEDNLVKLFNLDDNNRFYLPESKIAENGIWIKNSNDTDWNTWEKKDNLNTQLPGKPVWKFGYDSKKMLPYIQFPEDIANLIGDGLEIKYIRTLGTNGNVTAKALTKISGRTDVDIVGYSESETLPISEDNDNYLVIENSAYTLNGQDNETLEEAYNNFKKTVGTFDTLITCRDYANKIFELTYNQTNRTPLVSNVQVSDIKDDINFAAKIVSFDDYGLFYSNVALASSDITNFDIYIYPLKDITNYYKGTNYKNSFKPNYLNTYDIINQLQDFKTLSHNIRQIKNSEDAIGPNNIYAIKNYYHLNVRVSTTYKVTEFEGSEILNNIYYALWNNFNPRKLDYGEEIPYETLLKTIETADPRIKTVSLDEPELTTNVMYGNGQEEEIIDINGKSQNSSAKNVFLTLIAKNVLAGKLPLFNYDKRFKYKLGSTTFSEDNRIYGNPLVYPEEDGIEADEEYAITAITTSLQIPQGNIKYTLKENEVVNIIAPNLSTEIAYSLYVNYWSNFECTENTEYEFEDGNVLYINYTDSDNVVHDIKYYKDGNTFKYEEHLNNYSSYEVKEFSGIIKPNFTIKVSDTEHDSGRGWQKTENAYFKTKGEINGMFCLNGTQEIDIRSIVKTKINTSPFYCYWSLNGNKNALVFEGETPNAKSFIRTLGNDEYFFYTDSLKQTLITLGAGTTLKLVYTTAPQTTDNKITWTLNFPDVSLDDVASKGIGAFNDTKWQSFRFTENFYLEIQENQIITLGEGTTIDNVTLTDPRAVINSDWHNIYENSFVYNNGQYLTAYSINSLGSSPYKIQSRLNLNMSNSEGQVMHPNTEVNTGGYVIRKIILYSSAWYNKITHEYQQYKEEDKDRLEEYITDTASTGVPATKYKEFSGSLKDYYLMSNYALNQSGGIKINAHRYTVEEKLKDDLYIYPYEVKGVRGSSSNDSQAPGTDLTLESYSEDYYKISFETYKQVELPVFIPHSTFGLMMMYYTPPTALDPSNYPVVECAAINFFGQATSQTSIKLNKGINILKIWEDDGYPSEPEKSSEIKIKATSADRGTLIISNVDIVAITEENSLGVNTTLLNIKQSEVATLLNIIGTLDSNHIFYYNAPINKYNEIDTKAMDQYSFFNYNNTCNKFTIAELDTDNSSIQIAKSSRVTKW